jgi:hypothetical protein
MKILITEEQYRLIKEQDDSAYESVVEYLLSPDDANKEIGLILAKSQKMDLKKITMMIFAKKGLTSIKDIDVKLKKFHGSFYFSNTFLTTFVSMRANLKREGKNMFLYMQNNTSSKSVEKYNNKMLVGSVDADIDLEENEEEYNDFLEDAFENLIDITVLVLKEEIKQISKEVDESSEKIVSLLLSPQSDNKELGLYFIKSQDMDLDEIVDLLLESKDIYDFESFENVLNTEKDIYFYFPKDIFKITLDSLDEALKINISSKTERYYTAQESFDSKAEYDYFMEDIYIKLKNALKAHLMKEINRLKN